MTTTKKDVATNAFSWADKVSAMAGAGLEDVRSEDLAMPVFKLLQSLSPETKKSDPAYVQGASEGMWFDSIGRGAYDSILFVPARYVTHYVEWKSRKDGGGLVANHGADRSILSRCTRDPETGREVTPEGTEIVPTATWYGIVISGTNGDTEVPLNKQASIMLSGTQQKVSRKWLSDVASIKVPDKSGRMFTPPLYSMVYRLSSIPTKNDQGSWSLASFERAGWIFDFPNGDDLFESAKNFSEVSKEIQQQLVTSEHTDSVRALPKSSATLSDEIPF